MVLCWTPSQSFAVWWSLLLLIGFVSAIELISTPPLITPNDKDVSFKENVGENLLTCKGNQPVSWIFSRNLTLSLDQVVDKKDGLTKYINITTAVKNLQQFVGFYYCYYTSELSTNNTSEKELLRLFDDNKASRIYVYIEISDADQKFITGSPKVNGVLGSTATIPCLPTSKDLDVYLEDIMGNTIEVPYYPTIGFNVSQMNKDIKYDAYLCRTKTTTKQPIFIVDWSTQHNADQLKPVSESLNIKNQTAHSKAVIDGDKLVLKCTAFGTATAIRWIVGNKTYTKSEDRVILSGNKDGIQSAVLTIENVQLDDETFYNCCSVDIAVKDGNVEYNIVLESTFIRVRGKLDAFWPFLGICVEVFILCVIIFAYEKRRNNAKMNESDADESPELEKLKVKNQTTQ